MINDTQLHKGLSRFWTNQSEQNALVIAFSMFLVFCAFNTSQNFATSSNGNVGAISLGLLYGANTIGCLIVPNIMKNYISPKYAMFCGSMTYVFYIASNIKVYPILLYISSCVLGIGAGLVWIGEGVLMTQCANKYEKEYNLALNSQLGYFNGIFWCLFQFNQFVGNLVVALLFTYQISTATVYTVLTTINVAGTFLFLAIKPFSDRIIQMNGGASCLEAGKIMQPDEKAFEFEDEKVYVQKFDSNPNTIQQEQQEELMLYQNDNDNININKRENSVRVDVDALLVIKMWCDKHFWIILPITIYSGVTQGFQFGQFAPLIDGNANKFYCLASFGLFDAMTSLIFGKLSDKISRLYIIFVAMCAHSIVYIFLFMFCNNIYFENINIDVKQLNDNDDDCGNWFECHIISTNLYIWLILGAFLGIGDAGFNTQIFALYPILLGGDNPQAFANFNFWQSLSSMWCFFWEPYVSLPVKLASYFGVLVISGIPLFCTQLGQNAAKCKNPETVSL